MEPRIEISKLEQWMPKQQKPRQKDPNNDYTPDPMALARLKGVFSEREGEGPPTLAAEVGARALVEFAVACCGDETNFKMLDLKFPIFVTPVADGTVSFNAPAPVEGTWFEISPDDFDLRSDHDLRRFKAYKAFVDMIRLVPAATAATEDGGRKFGVFHIFCDPRPENDAEQSDLLKWEAVWARWEKAGQPG